MVTADELDAALHEAGGPQAFASLSDFVAWMGFRLPAFSGAFPSDFLRDSSVRFRGCREPLRMRRGTSDGDVAAQIFLRGEYAFLDAIAMKSNPVVVDLGANIGGFVHLADSLWPDALFVAVEPERGNADVLRKNTEGLARLGRLRLIEACAGGQVGRTSLDTSQGAWAVRMTEVGAKGEVRVITIPELVAEAGLDRIDLLKCDIEGAEAQLFGSCASWIGLVRSLVVEVHDPYLRSDLERDLARSGSALRWRATSPQPGVVKPTNSTHLFSLS